MNRNLISSAPASVSKDDEMFVETYQVEGTDYDLKMLEEYLSSNNLTWKVIEE
ncbi:hypothetical protein M3638_03035 [Oceanobacillus profundus]|uniref:hypothetical protein n=1 Tax=Oceanobacillus profundus TaxID=372463 RepID=UPI002041EAA8|nr:hypothetical protein [Oceanobacillus profundus]MCM3396814.1 hypothetical protein [Oceanobacillus profundus]